MLAPVALVLICLFFLVLYLRLWNADFEVPFAYNEDALLTSALVKGLIENDWYITNPSLGMPLGASSYDFPKSSGLHLICLKAIALFFPHYAVTLNLYFLLSFPLVALTSFFVFREFRLETVPASVCSLLFSFIHFHFYRGEWHLFHSAYFMVPPSILVILWLLQGKIVFSGKKDKSSKGLLGKVRSRSLVALVILLLTASTNFYLPFFTCFFLLVAGVLSAFQRRSFRPLVSGTILVVVVIAGVFINAYPHLAYRWSHGSNSSVANRHPREAEVYGLMISQLLLPGRFHRVDRLARFRSYYDRSTPLSSENGSPTLGLVGSTGFLGLLFLQFVPHFSRVFSRHAATLRSLAALNLAAILLAIVGGGSSLFAYLISPQIRAYNRMSIYIAFFGFFAVCIFLDWASTQYCRRGFRKVLFLVMCAALLIGGILDQTVDRYVPRYAEIAAMNDSDHDFVQKLETRLPERAMIFQLPYVPWPEFPTVSGLTDYQHFRPYLHSKTLRWSYGSMKGRIGDVWQREVVSRPPDQMARILAATGFAGIYVDRRGFPDYGDRMINRLVKIIGSEPLDSSDGHRAFFELQGYKSRLSKEYGGNWVAETVRSINQPVYLEWRRGFYGTEGEPPDTWRWSNGRGELVLYNMSSSRELVLRMTLSSQPGRNVRVRMRGDLFSAEVLINGETEFSQRLSLPEGEHRIQFSCDAPRIRSLNDPRHLVFRVRNYGLLPYGEKNLQGEYFREVARQTPRKTSK